MQSFFLMWNCMYMFFVVFLKMNCPEKNILYLKKTHCKNADLFHLQKHQSPHRSDHRLSDYDELFSGFWPSSLLLENFTHLKVWPHLVLTNISVDSKDDATNISISVPPTPLCAIPVVCK